MYQAVMLAVFVVVDIAAFYLFKDVLHLSETLSAFIMLVGTTSSILVKVMK